MPQYIYVGLDASGKETRGLIDAENAAAAARTLRERSIFPIRVSGGDAVAGAAPASTSLLQLLNPLSYRSPSVRDMVTFYRQLAMMLRAGIALAVALNECALMQTRLKFRRVLTEVNRKIAEGETFAGALSREKRIFPLLHTNLIAAGEQSGNLDMVLERLADNIERRHEIKLQLMSAMFYPSFVLTVALGIVAFMVVWVIPKFATFLAARRATLPNSTQMLLDVSDWGVAYGGYVLAVLGVVIFLLLAAYTTVTGKRIIDRVILALPVIGGASLLASMAQSAWNLSMLLRSGITILDSLRILGRVVGNLAIADGFTRSAEKLLEGCALSKAFEQQPHITRMMRQMAAVGEKSGSLDTVMQGVGEYYQKELTSRLKFIVVIIEPMLILTTGVIVFCVYYALFEAVMTVSKGGMS